jgi:cysteine desulfurase
MPSRPLADYAYLDHAATTPMHAAAVEAMLPFLRERFGNPSGGHALARDARLALDDARDVMADALGCRPGEIVFTGGGTEADNLAVIGVVEARPGTAVCSAIEHHAVLHAVEGARGRVVAVDSGAVVDLEALDAALDESVSVVSVMLANNEVGAIQPLADVAERVRDRAPHAVVHTDAVQAFPWLDVASLATPADLVAVSAHKFGGPKGVGALVVREGTPLRARLVGGGQERERRSGTQNVAGIAAMAAAALVTVERRKDVVERVSTLRDGLGDGLLATVDGARETGDRAGKVAGSCHFTFGGVEAEALLYLLEQDGVLAAAGSSCASGAQEPSHVLTAMGIPRERALGAVRLSLGAASTLADVDRALDVIPRAVARLRSHGS